MSTSVSYTHLDVYKRQVRDNGCGFDEKVQKKLGSGLGLKLVDSLVRSNLKGTVSVSSSDQGTVTRFSFRNSGKK